MKDARAHAAFVLLQAAIDLRGYDKVRARRDAAILELSRLGVSRRRVAGLAGLSGGRVQQIIDRERQQPAAGRGAIEAPRPPR